MGRSIRIGDGAFDITEVTRLRFIDIADLGVFAFVGENGRPFFGLLIGFLTFEERQNFLPQSLLCTFESCGVFEILRKIQRKDGLFTSWKWKFSLTRIDAFGGTRQRGNSTLWLRLERERRKGILEDSKIG